MARALAEGGIKVEDFEVELPSSGGRKIRGVRYTRSGQGSGGGGGGEGEYSSGDGAGRWIFLHGWLDNAGSFEKLVPLLFAEDPPAATGLRDHNMAVVEPGSAEPLPPASVGRVQDVVCIDMSGHGRSDHKHGPYPVADFSAETMQVADRVFGQGQPFNLLGHSLGANVSLLVAGSCPDRVLRLVMLESAGSQTERERDGPALLHRAIAKVPSGRTSVFDSPTQAAERRVAKNVVPDSWFKLPSALALVDRGVRPAGGGGVTWSSDPWLMTPTRIYLSDAQQTAFSRAVRAPTLVLLAQDGMFKALLRNPIVKLTGPFTVMTGLVCEAFAAFLWLRQRLTGHPEPMTRLVRRVRGLGVRVRALKTGKVRFLKEGGHHPQLSQPRNVAAALLK